MFESLQENLISAIKTISGKGRLTEANMRSGLDMVRKSLLEADVSFPVVKDFMARISEQALGEKVMKLLNPTQAVVQIVHDELVNLMGPVDSSLHLKKPLTILMLCGLQGSGKTTTCSKLAKLLQLQKVKPMLVAADLQRPAAIDQLEILGNKIGIPVHVERDTKDPVSVCQNAVRKAKELEVDVLILDTAGRLHIDQELMNQLSTIEKRVQPDQVLFVVDAMTGQDAVNSAKAFNDALSLDGVILTKLDGDTRGGAALSVKHITGVPIKYIGTGEGIDELEEFRPEGMAERILGMGDMVSLIRQAQLKFDQDEMEKQQAKLAKGEFTLDDFRTQMQQIKRLGSMSKILSFLPGMGNLSQMMGGANIDADDEMKRVGGIIDAMTLEERRNPRVIDQSRRRRIAQGAGVEPHQVNELIKGFLPMADMMKSMSSMGKRDQMKAVQQLAGNMQNNPGGNISKVKVPVKKLSAKEKAKAKKDREKERRREKRNKKNEG